jgi:hypothetical protein
MAVVLSCGSLVAQKMLLRDDHDQQVAVFAVRDLAGQGAEADVAVPAGRSARWDPAGAKEIATLLGSTVRRPGDHVEAIGPGHVVALGQPDWVGAVESMLERLRSAERRQYQVDTRFCRVSAALVGELDADLLPGIKNAGAGSSAVRRVLGQGEAARLWRAIRSDKQSTTAQAPQIVANELDRVNIRVGRNVEYMPRVEQGGAQQLAVPVVDTIWNGDKATLVVGTTSREKFSVNAEVESQVVDFPGSGIGDAGAVGTNGPAIQELRVRACRASGCEEMADNATLVIATRDSGDNTWAVTLVTLFEIWGAQGPWRAR